MHGHRREAKAPRRWRIALGGLLIVAFCSVAVGAEPVPPGYRRVAVEHGIPAVLFYAVAKTESGRRLARTPRMRPWPWTLNIEGRGRYYGTRIEAFAALKHLLREGRTSIDIGLMQVNWRYHHTRLRDPWRALDPYYNLRVGARILRDCYRAHADWWRAVGCYHSPGSSAAQRERALAYRARVKRHWLRLG
jgi:soluble lytic murein transglycosylase-like protein